MCMCLFPIRITRKVDRKDPLPIHKDNGQTFYLVPCGKCSECCKRRKNDWYVRCRFEERFGKYTQILFCSFTFDNDHLPNTKEELSHRIRCFKDRLRKELGYMPTHFLVSERGPDTNRIHLHGFLYCKERELYNTIRECWIDGYCWIEPMRDVKAITYSMKYILKGFLDRNLDDKLVGRIYASLHFGQGYVSDQSVRYHFRPNDEYGYNRLVTFYDRGKTFKYALPAYLMRKIEEWVGFKKMCSPEDFQLQILQSNIVSKSVRDSSCYKWLEKTKFYYKTYQTSVFNG